MFLKRLRSSASAAHPISFSMDLHRARRRRCRRESGASALMAALLFSVLLGLVAIGIDTATTMQARRKAANAADAAVFAGTTAYTAAYNVDPALPVLPPGPVSRAQRDADARVRNARAGAFAEVRRYAQANLSLTAAAWAACSDPMLVADQALPLEQRRFAVADYAPWCVGVDDTDPTTPILFVKLPLSSATSFARALGRRDLDASAGDRLSKTNVAVTTSTTTTTTTTTLPPVTSAPPPGTPCSAVNLLSNPSFESGLTGWDTTGYVYTITAYVRDGSYIAYASAPDGSISQTVPAVPGDRYEVWHYSGTHEPGSDAKVALEFLNGGGAVLASYALDADTDIDPAPSLLGGPFVITATAPPATASIRVRAWVTTDDAVKVDGFVLAACPTVTTTAALAPTTTAALAPTTTAALAPTTTAALAPTTTAVLAPTTTAVLAPTTTAVLAPTTTLAAGTTTTTRPPTTTTTTRPPTTTTTTRPPTTTTTTTTTTTRPPTGCGTGGLCVLNTASNGAITGGGGGNLVKVLNGSIAVNSNHASSVEMWGGDYQSTPCGTAAPNRLETTGSGRVLLSGGFASGNRPQQCPSLAQLSQPQFADPLAGLTTPTLTSGTSTPWLNVTTNRTLAAGRYDGIQTSNAVSLTLNPGVFGALQTGGAGGTVTLNPGIYVITGRWAINGQDRIVGTNVLLFFTCGTPAAPRLCGGAGEAGGMWSTGGSMHPSSLVSGRTTADPTFSGLVLYYDRNNVSNLELNGNDSALSSLFRGTIYAARSNFVFGGVDNPTASFATGSVIVNRLTLNGSSDLLIDAAGGLRPSL